ncbi:MAG: hypothetical protein A2007_02740 [Verrucomicrobia bacterium GWC2_42_7]|nr:MAG: hypothetical protein A2007_02740 [Verrucomicrobia bacterium GWC2_42_7]
MRKPFFSRKEKFSRFPKKSEYCGIKFSAKFPPAQELLSRNELRINNLIIIRKVITFLEQGQKKFVLFAQPRRKILAHVF